MLGGWLPGYAPICCFLSSHAVMFWHVRLCSEYESTNMLFRVVLCSPRCKVILKFIRLMGLTPAGTPSTPVPLTDATATCWSPP